ncbi:hypothetical protein DPMN_187347 [Dreissena polymorpha]|uniref:Uncharacterized protein n=1 Tax=Dreissena polymorpha TaxID=45954 RepID=A0A9D4DNW2_DREPO|nr:hypothetical protein DPMN_187347 [Dreissena polymorpha]
MLQGLDGKFILARALTKSYAPKEFMIDQSLQYFPARTGEDNSATGFQLFNCC